MISFPGSKKGFALSLDAAIAVIIALLMITGSMFYISQNSHLNLEDPTVLTAMDALAVLEKNGGLAEYAVEGSDGAVEDVFGALPYEECMRVTFYSADAGGALHKLGSVQREGCGYPEEYSIARRMFTAGGSIYVAELEGWGR